MVSEFKAAGLSSTRVRIAILSAIRASRTPLSAEAVGEELTRSGCTIGRASLFRNLDLFRSAGLIERIETGNRGNQYLAKCSGNHHHHHILCEKCRSIEPVDICLSTAMLKTIEQSTDYRVTGHSLMLYGLCRKCRKRKQSRRTD